jgi:hypothetical protein
MLSIHPRLGLPNGLFPSGFPINNLHTFLFSLFRPHHLPRTYNSNYTWRFGGMYHILHQVEKNKHSVLQLLVTANVVLSSLIVFTLMMEEIISSETSALARATRRKIPEDVILHSHRWALQRWRNVFPVKYVLGFHIPEDGIIRSHRRENLKSYKIT